MAEFGAPQSRNEAILQNMLGAHNALSPPESRIENLLIQILNQGGGGDNVFIATYGTTASGDIAAAINTRKIIIVAKGANVPSEIAVAAQVDGTRVYLHTTKIRTEGTRTAPIFMKTVVDGTTWTTEEIAVATEEQTPFLATINVTTNAQLTAAINAGWPILVKAQGDGQPIYSVLYAMKLTSGVVHLITANIVADEEMNNRLRPTFHAYDVDGSTWTALAPVTALVPRDLANIVMALPETGVINMRYLLYVPDNSAVGYHYDEYLYVNRNWVCISNDKTFVATIGATTAATLKDAINAGKIIYVKAAGENEPCFISTMVQVAANNDITLNCTELVHDSQRDIYVPTYTRHSVNGTTNVWTSDTVEALPFIATINTTPETALKAAIDSKREILVTTSGTNRPYQTAFYAENKGDNGVYLICAKINEDTERWNRLRPTFEAWTIRGTVWTAADPLEAVVEDDLVNILTALPTAGVPKTRYLLKVPDISAEGHHLDEYIYTENKWICISRDNVVRVKTNVTTEAELIAAIGAGKIILITDTAAASEAVVHSVVGTGHVDLYTVEQDATKAAIAPRFCRHRVVGAAWTKTAADLGAFLATVNVTTEAALKEVIGAQREMLLTTGDDQPYHTVVYAENKGTDGAYLICADITKDMDRWDRLRPTFHAYTVVGSVWTASDPLEAVVEDDLANIMNALPTAGVPKTRYLLKVPDISAEGHHLDEYIYTENKWICISRDNVVRVKTNVTTEAELTAAIEAGKTILITDTEAASAAVVHSVVGTGYVDLYTVEQDAAKAAMAPRFCRHRVVGAAWTKTAADLGAFLATVNVTTEAALKEVIGAQREMLLTTGDNQPYHAVIYAEDKGDDGAYIISADITVDADRWDRLRPTFHAFTIRGNVWTAADPLEAVVEDDLANILTELPTTGVPKTRYMLKVPDISAEGYHLDEYIYTENKWICISRDNVIRVKPNVTTETELSAAISAGKTILITDAATESRAVVHSFVGTGYVDLYTVEYDTDEAAVSPGFVRNRVVGAAWTETIVGLGAFVATVDSTTELALKGAIGERREILLTTGDDQPYHTVVYAEDKGTDGAYIVVSGIVTDTDRWNRKRSRFAAYTVLGNLWTAADPIDALIAEDLTNIVTALPTTGVANTRYLLKVTDASTVGYHLDEYIYTENKWVYISKEQPAPFIATIKVTSQAEIMAAVNSNSPIYIYSDITGTLWPAISAVANAFTATVRYLTVGSSSGNYTVDIVSYSVVGTTWTPTQIGIALKTDLEKYVPKLATPISESTTNYLRAFKMNADGLITGTSGSYTKSDTISSSSTTNQLPSAKSVRDYVATPTEVSLTYNTTYISANYSKCYKVAERVYMCNIAFQTKSDTDVPANTWLIRFPENIVSSGVEVYCILHCTDRNNVPATLLLQMGGTSHFKEFIVKTNPIPANKYYFGNVMIIKTA